METLVVICGLAIISAIINSNCARLVRKTFNVDYPFFQMTLTDSLAATFCDLSLSVLSVLKITFLSELKNLFCIFFWIFLYAPHFIGSTVVVLIAYYRYKGTFLILANKSWDQSKLILVSISSLVLVSIYVLVLTLMHTFTPIQFLPIMNKCQRIDNEGDDDVTVSVLTNLILVLTPPLLLNIFALIINVGLQRFFRSRNDPFFEEDNEHHADHPIFPMLETPIFLAIHKRATLVITITVVVNSVAPIILAQTTNVSNMLFLSMPVLICNMVRNPIIYLLVKSPNIKRIEKINAAMVRYNRRKWEIDLALEEREQRRQRQAEAHEEQGQVIDQIESSF